MIKVRVASAVNGSFRVEMNAGTVLLAEFDVATGGWQNWDTLEKTVFIPAGDHSLGVASVSGAWNFNWIDIVPESTPNNDEDDDGVEDSIDQCPGTVDVPVDSQGCPITTTNIKVMSFNVRTADANDPGEGNWYNRREELIRTIERHSPSVIAIQEANGEQSAYIKSSLAGNWQSSNLGLIMYRAEQYSVVARGRISLVADVWGQRYAEWLRLRHSSGREFVFLGTHWGVDANSQQGAAEILRNSLYTVNDNWTLPTLLLGDLNVAPNTNPLNTLLDGTPLQNFIWGESFNGWNPYGVVQLDYILGHNVNASECLMDTYKEGSLPPSDHFPLVCNIGF